MRHAHDPDVTDAEFTDLADAARDATPTWPELDDSPEPIVTVPPVEACEECATTCAHPLLCALQRTVVSRPERERA